MLMVMSSKYVYALLNEWFTLDITKTVYHQVNCKLVIHYVFFPAIPSPLLHCSCCLSLHNTSWCVHGNMGFQAHWTGFNHFVLRVFLWGRLMIGSRSVGWSSIVDLMCCMWFWTKTFIQWLFRCMPSTPMWESTLMQSLSVMFHARRLAKSLRSALMRCVFCVTLGVTFLRWVIVEIVNRF